MYDDVGRVYAELCVSGTGRSPNDIGRILGVQHDYTHKRGDPIISAAGREVDSRKRNFWSFSTESLTTSKSLEDHLQALLEIFAPLAAAIRTLQELDEVFIICRWQSSRLVAGSGPILSADTCHGVSLLGTELHFDIYCSNCA
jgi:hypothetical protein